MANYSEYLTDPATGEIALIKSNDYFLFKQKKQQKIEQWSKRAVRESKVRTKEMGLNQAIQKTNDALNDIQLCNKILSHTLSIDDKIDWDSLIDKRSFKLFYFEEAEPKKDKYFLLVPSKFFWENIFIFLKKKRLTMEAKAETEFNKAIIKYNNELENAKKNYQSEKDNFYNEQKKYNDDIEKMKNEFEASVPEAVQKYIELVLERSQYPECIDLSSEVAYLPDRKSAIINMFLPAPEKVPSVIEYKYIASRNEFTTKCLKKSDQKENYENIISQICIRTIHEVFESVYTNAADIVVFNGFVTAIDPKTGNETTNCIISVQAEKNQFFSFNLKNITARECIKGLKGVVASEFINLAPVKPILIIDRNDKRIIEADNVIDSADAKNNLANMDWQKFEALVRDLFEKEFAGEGVEVKVTQASRDAGVDAIIFDPDPIKGGKFVIQAKRYNNIVGVSAVRDLYGTVLNEGAVKGILVTTSSYGKDSIEFAKDKPLTLISGSELVFLFNKHGYKVNIQTRKK
jgi:restriction system protein